ncbi:MAG: potassium-transporting ATPase subunit C [Thermoplasmata archaeon]|nr:potassium-transporting ATPase subunit C [Thermoplasmata archaeon]
MTVHPPRPVRPLDPIPDETATEAPPVPAGHHPVLGHLRASIVLLVLTVFLLGLAYPGAITFFAQKVEATSANGSLYYVNGTAYGSTLIAQNLSAPWLFWERPTPYDYNSSLGSPTLLGYSDPALVNETKSYMQQYGPYKVNASVPAILVTISGSGLDPDLTPEAVLVQIPRIAAHSNLTEAELNTLVDAYIIPPFAGFIGPAYVDVFKLDLKLLTLEHRSV